MRLGDERFYGYAGPIADGKHSHDIEENHLIELQCTFAKLTREEGFELLQQEFTRMDCKIPVLYKQYAALCEEGGYRSLAFSVDTEFGSCVDGLFVGDITQMKAAKRARHFKTNSVNTNSF